MVLEVADIIGLTLPCVYVASSWFHNVSGDSVSIMNGQHIYSFSPTLVFLQVLWIVVIITLNTESISTAPQETFISQIDVKTYQRIRRSPDEETFHSRIPKKVEDYESSEEDLNETQFQRQKSSIEDTPGESTADDIKDSSHLIKGEPNKNKQNESKKYNPNDFKTKLNLEAKTLAANESAIEKQKLPLYNPNPVLKYNNSFKKDSKLNSSSSDYNFKVDNSNSKVPSKFILEKKKVKSDTDEVLMNITKVPKPNETRLMSDQPVATDGDLGHNATSDSDASDEDDSLDDLSQNSTTLNEDRYNFTTDDVTDEPTTMPSEEFNVVMISGVTLGTAVLLGLVAGGGFVFYRNRMWNKPQTLSDKCSNADSSGYIDDSTLRENSEEMYSLDNDSFLNSLEAMTIQNYWTDNVKHTKL